MDHPITRSGSEGLKPLYHLYQWFLNDEVQTYTIGDLIEDNGIQKWSEFDANFLGEWQDWAGHFAGFFAAVAVGVFLVIGIPILGLCYCWCRSICRCKPQCVCCRDLNLVSSNPAMAPSKCKTRTCLCVLFSLVMTMFAMVVIMFVLNSNVNNELTNENLMTQDIIQAIHNVEKYLKGSVDDIETALIEPLNGTSEDILVFLEAWPDDVVDGLETESGLQPAMNEVNEYTENLLLLSGNLSMMNNFTETLSDDIEQLNENITASRNNIAPLVDECIALSKEDICYTIKGKLSDLEVRANFSNFGNLTPIISDINSEIGMDILNHVQSNISLWNNVTAEIRKQVSGNSASFRDFIIELEVEIHSVVNQVNATLTGLSVSQATGAVEDVQLHYLDQYAPYYSAVIVTVTSLCLVIVVLHFLGLILGISCGPRTAKHAANLLMSAIAFFFLFGWIFVLLTTLTFLVGGGIEVLVCRHAVVYDETMDAIETITKNQFEVNYIISGRQFMESCSNNQALYTSLNLENNGFNISQYLDLSQTEVYDSLGNIQNISINIPYLDILEMNLEKRLLDLYRQTSEIDFEAYTSELEQAIVSVDISGICSDLVQAADMLKSSSAYNASSLSEKLKAEADVLLELDTLVIPEIEVIWYGLTEATIMAEVMANTPNISEAISGISEAEQRLVNSTDLVLKPVMNESVENIVLILENYTGDVVHSIEQDVAPCRILYDSVQSVIYAPCAYFLYPFNAFWFCSGWYFSFGLVAVFVATSYVNILRFKSQHNKLYPASSVSSTTISFIEEDLVMDDDQANLMVAGNASQKIGSITPATTLNHPASPKNINPVMKELTNASINSERTKISIISNRISPVYPGEQPVKDQEKHHSFLNYLDFVYGSSTYSDK